MKTSYGFDRDRKLWVPKSDLFGKYYYAEFGYTVLGFGGGVEGPGLWGSDFDGSADYAKLGGVGGATDTDRGTLSLWYRVDGGAGADRHIFRSTNFRILIRIGIPNVYRALLFDSGGTVKVEMKSLTTLGVDATTWHHLAHSWISGGRAQFRLDGVDDADVVVNNAADIDWTDVDLACGARVDGAGKFNGPMSETYLTIGESVDLDADIGKFISGGKPVPLGPLGKGPTGNQPYIYYPKGDPSENEGTSGNMVITGALDTIPGPGV